MSVIFIVIFDGLTETVSLCHTFLTVNNFLNSVSVSFLAGSVGFSSPVSSSFIFPVALFVNAVFAVSIPTYTTLIFNSSFSVYAPSLNVSISTCFVYVIVFVLASYFALNPSTFISDFSSFIAYGNSSTIVIVAFPLYLSTFVV